MSFLDCYKRNLWILVIGSVALTAACNQRPMDPYPSKYSIQWTPIDELPNRPMHNSVWGSSPNDIYIATFGNRYYHFDGLSWEELAFRGNKPKDFPLTSYPQIWGTGPNDVYVADGGLFHFDGVSWSEQPVDADLVGGAAPNDVYAVDRRYVHHYNGVYWSLLHDLGDYRDIEAIWAAPGPNLVLVRRGSIVHWDGARWWESDSTGYYLDIWGTSPDDLYAVGNLGTGSEGKVIHYDGNNWTTMPIPVKTQRLTSVWGSASNNIYAVGLNGTVIFFNGTAWAAVDRITSKLLRSIWGSGATDIYAVGYDEKVIHFDGSAWFSIWEDKPDNPRRIWGESTTRLAVSILSYGGSIYLFESGLWKELFIKETLAYVMALGGFSLDDLFVSMTDRTMAHFDGSAWSIFPDTLAGVQRAFWASPSNDLFSVGDRSIYRFNGSTWELMMEDASISLQSVWGTSSNNIYAVGQDGVILFYNGNFWTRMESGTDRSFNDIWGTSESDVFAVGLAGIFHYDGRRWISHPIPKGSGWFDWVSGLSSYNVFAGGGGSITHYDGVLWSSPMSVDRTLDAITTADGSIIHLSKYGISYYRE